MDEGRKMEGKKEKNKRREENCTQRKVFGLPNWTYTPDHLWLKMQLASNASSASESIAHGMTLFQDTAVFLFPASPGLDAGECMT